MTETPYTLTYVVAAEAWYHEHLPANVQKDALWIAKSHEDGGCAWEFSVEQVDRIGVQVKIFDDAWQAFAEVPDLFHGFSEMGQGATLGAVREMLDHLDFTDKTERTRAVNA